MLYLDALGTKEAARTINDDDLFDFVNAEAWYRRFLHHHNLEMVQQSLYFTDDIVVARPDDAGCEESLRSLFELLLGVGVYVVGMAIEIGRVVRGGFARGPACIDANPLAKDGFARFNVAHGEGLIRAVVLEQQRARMPRVVLGNEVLAQIESCVSGVSDPGAFFFVNKPQLVRDLADEEVFVDHLGEVLSDTEPNLNILDGGTPTPRAAITDQYRAFVISNLDHPQAAAKYLWLAEYYDFSVARYGVGAPIGVGDASHFEIPSVSAG